MILRPLKIVVLVSFLHHKIIIVMYYGHRNLAHEYCSHYNDIIIFMLNYI